MNKDERKSINVTELCQQAIQIKLNMYQAKENFEATLKFYNDQVDYLINSLQTAQNKIIELQEEFTAFKGETQEKLIPAKVQESDEGKI